ncbi:hypothetical protein ACVRWB_07860 [Streptococcus troglodytae]|uniref:Peptidase-like protein n=1 Tax=Streptococcus troglodytae TaxID=1111760 RepID=A0A1L7LH72_9STRE|nr:peptidase-like protein precursor [Streptococcus troglodytae]
MKKLYLSIIVMLIASAGFSTLARIGTTTPSKTVRYICAGLGLLECLLIAVYAIVYFKIK